MDILEQFIDLMLKKVEIKPVPKHELDQFLLQNNIEIDEEHYQFLLTYGNSDFLKRDYANLTFDYFKSYYLDDDILEDAILPKFCGYLGTDFSSETICLDYQDKKIYLFDYGEKDLEYYGGLKELLFFILFKLLIENQYFHKIKTNIKIENIEQFKNQYLPYEIKNIHRYTRYFLKNGILISCDNEFYSYNLYQGGILNEIKLM